MVLSKSKQAERDYYSRLGAVGIAHSVAKPFSDDNCAKYLVNLAALFSVMEPPPARVVEFGCGTGWLSHFMAQRGYDVVGIDISSDAIDLAKEVAVARHLKTVRFVAADYETFAPDAPFNYAIFHDALHHAESELEALRCAHRALLDGGAVLLIEPGAGHHKAASARRAVEEFGVCEKDMPPSHIVAVARLAGFRRHLVLPFPWNLLRFVYRRIYHGIMAPMERRSRYLLGFVRVLRQFLPTRNEGLVILWK